MRASSSTLAVAGRADDGRGLRELQFLRGAPAALARDELEFIGDFPDDERLDDALLADALDELLQVLAAEFMAGLQRTGNNLVERNVSAHARPVLRLDQAQPTRVLINRAESFAECRFCHEKNRVDKMNAGRW